MNGIDPTTTRFLALSRIRNEAMLSPYHKYTLLLVLLVQSSVESRSWQRRPLVHPSILPAPTRYLQLRGGDESGIPKVPQEANTRIVQPGVSRGGSTKAEKYPGGVTVYTPSGGSSVATPTPDTDAVTASDAITTTIGTEIVEAADIAPEAAAPKKEKKRFKKHKQIAKKLKVSEFG